MADPLQPPLPQPPNWGAYVAGVDTIQWYYLTEADEAATATYFFSQKVTNFEERNKFLAAVVDAPGGPTLPGVGQITGGEFRGDSTQGTKTAGVAFIPNSLPGGYTP